MSYSDTTAAIGTVYYYWVKAYNGSGDSPFSSYNTGWRAAVLAPTSVSASDGAFTGKVRITWTASSGATGYKVFRNNVYNPSTAMQIGTTPASPYDDWTAAAGTTYYYWVKAYNANGDSILSGWNTGYRIVATATLPEALDNPALSFTCGGDGDWFGQSTVSYNGGDAAQSGNISHSQELWMETTVSGSGTVMFWWKVSSEASYDYLEFYIDGVLQTGAISGTVDWTQKTFAITGTGSHTLKWRYMKDGSVDGGSDFGWVDKVEWVQ